MVRTQQSHQWLPLILLLATIMAGPACNQAVPADPPVSKVEVVVDTLHGHGIEDPYRWLEEQDSSDTRVWIDAQNRYTQSVLERISGREKVRQRLTELIKVDRIGRPIERNGRYFLYKRAADQDQYVIYKREGLHGADEVLVDANAMSTDHSVSCDILDISRDGKLLAYTVQRGGEDEKEVRFLDVETGQELADVFPRANYFGLSITADNRALYYCLYDFEKGARVYYHAFGADRAEDKLIFGEGYGPEKIIGCELSEDRRYLLLPVYYGSSGTKNEFYYLDVAKGGPVKTLVNDIEARFYGQVAGGKIFVQTNWEAPNWRILAVDLSKPARKYWKEIIPASDAGIEDFSLAGGKIFVAYLENVSSRVKIFEPDGKETGELPVPSLGSVTGIIGQWNGDELFYQFSSYHIPSTVYRYDVATGEQEIFTRRNAPVDTDKIEVRQVWFESRDGTKVPMFVVHAKDLKLDGQRPTYLYGYGGFNSSETPYFNSLAVLWAEQGGVFAVANIRGGGEFGDDWHQAAMFEKKQNSFDDFIAAAEWLIANNYTNSSKLAISGGSNGGLLVGAVMNQRPELCRAVVCWHPLLDMLRYHKFLMGPFWVTEYGSADEPDQFEYIYEYSPYHHVKKGTKYPAVLLISGDSDTRVDPMHARKMTALLQATTGSDNPVLLYYDTKAGHSGGRPATQQIEDLTVETSFLWWQLGVDF